MERMSVDITGSFPCTERGNKYSVWIILLSGQRCACFLVDQVFIRFGILCQLHSDQGREFESRVFREFCRLLSIHKTRTTPLRPQSDEMVERSIPTTGEVL